MISGNKSIRSLGNFAAELARVLDWDVQQSRKATVSWLGMPLCGKNWSEPLQRLNRLTHAKAEAILRGIEAKIGRQPEWLKPGWSQGPHDLAGRQAWLAAVIAALDPQAQPAPGLPDPAWRRVGRPAMNDIIAAKVYRKPLDPIAVIIGMSGTGKTLLARLYYAEAPEPKTWFAAPRLADDGTPADLGDLTRAIMDALAAEVSGYPGGYDKALAALTSLLPAIARDIARYEPGQTEPELTKSILQELAAKARQVPILAQVLMPYARRVHDAAVLRKICAFFARCDPRTPPHLVVLDDVWPDPAFDALVACLLPPAEATSWPLHLLVTSQQRAAAFTADDLRAQARTIELDRDETDRPGFARRLVAAWASPAGEYTPEEAQQHITAFATRLEPRGDMAGQKPAIEAVLAAIGHHPLLTSAIASWWRELGYDPQIWEDMTECLAGARMPDRPFRPAADPGGELSAHHEQIVRALLYIVERSLNAAEKARYFDLILHAGRAPLNEAVFRLLWRHAKRGGQIATTTSSDAMRTFAQRMLVQQNGSTYVLHDMHRSVIAGALGPNGIAALHRDLLAAAGLLTPAGKFDIDNPAHFAVSPGDPAVPNSGRWLLRLGVTGATEAVNAYFMDALHGHVKAVVGLSGLHDAEWHLLTCLRFLQSQLDWIEPVGQTPEGALPQSGST